MNAFERRVARTLGPTKENNTWRMRYNNVLYKQFEEPSISNIIKLKRLQWPGHIYRTDGSTFRKKIGKAALLGKGL
jgi:hypothetical protein